MPDNPSLSRRTLLRHARDGAIGALLASTAPGLFAADPMPTKPINFLLLKSDEHHPMVTSAHGHPLVQTPNMKALADRKVMGKLVVRV